MPEQVISQSFGKLTVISEPFYQLPKQSSKKKRTFVTVKCDCGVTKNVMLQKLKSGNTVSCGCHRSSGMNYKHGLITHPIYIVWQSMRQRCNDFHHKAYKNYGGRGISICAEWSDFQIFFEWAIKNGWKEGLEIDRENNDGNYEPSNCRFITPKENIRNRGYNKLTMEDAVDIRRMAGLYSQRQLATMYNTCQTNIGNVIRNKIWN